MLQVDDIRTFRGVRPLKKRLLRFGLYVLLPLCGSILIVGMTFLYVRSNNKTANTTHCASVTLQQYDVTANPSISIPSSTNFIYTKITPTISVAAMSSQDGICTVHVTGFFTIGTYVKRHATQKAGQPEYLFCVGAAAVCNDQQLGQFVYVAGCGTVVTPNICKNMTVSVVANQSSVIISFSRTTSASVVITVSYYTGLGMG